MKRRVPCSPGTQPGARNPDNPREVCVLCTSRATCPLYPDGRWLASDTPLKLAAANFLIRCHMCAQRARWRRPDHRHPRLRTGHLPLLDGSTALLSPEDRPPELVKEMRAKILCGICGKEHEAGISWGKESNGICEECQPWLVLLLRREQCMVDNEKRKDTYDKIKRIREAFKDDALLDPASAGMPFWALAKKWAEWYQRVNKSSSWGVYLAHYRHAVLYFMDKPIGEIGDEDVKRFGEALLTQRGLRGTRMNTTVVKTVETLRRIFKYAQMMEWIEKIPTCGEITRAQRKSEKKKQRGGAHNVKWTPERRAELLRHYEDAYKKVKGQDSSLPENVREKIKLKGYKPSDIALDYAAEQLGVESSEYLRRTVLPAARREHA